MATKNKLDKFIIGGLPFQILYNSEELKEAGCYGRINYEKQTITTRPEYTPEFAVLNLWHEALHGLLWVYGIKLGDSAEEEKLVAVLAHALYRFSQDNNGLRWTEIEKEQG